LNGKTNFIRHQHCTKVQWSHKNKSKAYNKPRSGRTSSPLQMEDITISKPFNFLVLPNWFYFFKTTQLALNSCCQQPNW
jgi:hypothetical protein